MNSPVYWEVDIVDEYALTAMRLRAIRLNSLSSNEAFTAAFNEPVVTVTESANCFGVNEPVFDRVTILRPSAPNAETN